jgi:hypothetical protein
MVRTHADRLRMERYLSFLRSTSFIRAALLGACVLSARQSCRVGRGAGSHARFQRLRCACRWIVSERRQPQRSAFRRRRGAALRRLRHPHRPQSLGYFRCVYSREPDARNWHYNDNPGTAGVTYGYQRQESRIIALRPSPAVSAPSGRRGPPGLVYNQNIVDTVRHPLCPRQVLVLRRAPDRDGD